MTGHGLPAAATDAMLTGIGWARDSFRNSLSNPGRHEELGRRQGPPR